MALMDDYYVVETISRKRRTRPELTILQYFEIFMAKQRVVDYENYRYHFAQLDKEAIEFLKNTKESIIDWRCNHKWLFRRDCSLLHVAIDLEAYYLLEWLLQQGLDPNVQDSWMRSTPLHIAYKRIELIELLLSYKANPNIPNSIGQLPILNTDDPKIVDVLIKAGSEVNTRNYSQKTPLQVACFRGQDKKIDLLLQAGAGFSSDDRGFSDIHFLSDHSDKRDTVEKLLLLKFGEDIERLQKEKFFNGV